MADQAPAVASQKSERAAAPERVARQEGGGLGGAIGFAMPLGQAVDLAQLLPRLGAADLASRARAVLSLQRSHGNTAVAASIRPLSNQRPLLQRQWGMPRFPAAPAGGASAPAPAPPAAAPAPGARSTGEAAAETEPEAEPKPPDEFDRGLLRTVETARRILQLHKLGKSDSSPEVRDLMALVPNQWVEYRTGKIRGDIADLLVEKWLPSRAMQMANTMLDDSARVARAEGERYKAGKGPGEAADLRRAATELIRAEDEFARITAAANSMTDDPNAERSSPIIAQAAQDLERTRSAYGAVYPILQVPGIDIHAVAKADDATLNRMVQDPVSKTLGRIDESREYLRKGELDVWDLAPVIARVKEYYGIQPGSVVDQLIENERKRRAKKSLIEGIVTGVLMLGLGLVAIFTTGGLALVALGTGATLSAEQAISHIADYQVKRAARGSALVSARAISAEDPSLFWLAVDIVGAVLDLGAAAKAFRTLSAVAEDLTILEQQARAEAERLRAAGDLKGTPEQFVQKILKSARAARGPVALRARILRELLQGSGPRVVSLLAGEEKAMVGLLKQWGNWKEVMLVLEAGSPEMRGIARKLSEFREGVVLKLGRSPAEGGIGAVRAGKPSAELISDVDLSVRTGADLIQAEAYMAKTYGRNWSKIFRINFYTEATRLYKYADVIKRLGRAARAALQTRITTTAERLNLAKMLRHAGTDAQSVTRVQGFIKAVVKDKAELAKIGELAATKEAKGLARRDDLLREVDALAEKFESATKDEQVHLAEEITEKQMEANFWTEEATIGPGGAREVVAGVRVIGPEAYQSALSWLEGIEHVLHEAGGDVVKAAREYELFKYVNRFSTASARAGVFSKSLAYFDSLSEYIYRVYRGAHAEIPSGLPEDWLRRPFVRPSDRIAFPVPRAGDEFLRSQFDEFVQEARSALPKIKEKALARPSEWAEAPAETLTEATPRPKVLGAPPSRDIPNPRTRAVSGEISPAR